MQSKRENDVGKISKEHEGKVIGGLRKESEPNPALVHGGSRSSIADVK